MAPEIRKAAEAYVKDQVQRFDGKVPAKDVKEAIQKVAAALEEVQEAKAEAQRCVASAERMVSRHGKSLAKLGALQIADAILAASKERP